MTHVLLRICGKGIDEQLVQMLCALHPRWVKRRGIFQLCSLLRGRRGRALEDGTGVKERLELLCDQAECGVLVCHYNKGDGNFWTSSRMRVCRKIGRAHV